MESQQRVDVGEVEEGGREGGVGREGGEHRAQTAVRPWGKINDFT